MSGAVQSYLLALPALFSIVNPLAMALIFSQVTADRGRDGKRELARRIALYAAIIMLVALWGGAYILNFFGISLAALRIGGGLVVATSAWALLQRPEQDEARKHEQASHATGADVAFYPLTMPFTTGPGTIAVSIAIGSNLPVAGPDAIPYALGASAAALTIAAIVLVAYSGADRLVALLGPAQARVVTRLSAFLLLCVGVQITLNGVAEFLGTL
jgi:multiple antibiotic resistance protein